MTAHHDRVRAILLVAEIEADRCDQWGEPGLTVADITSRLTRIQACLARSGPPVSAGGDGGDAGDEGEPDAEAWLLAAYDATLAELCGKLDLGHFLTDASVAPEAERLRVELELLTSLLPLG